MRDERLEIGVTFDSERGYIGSAPDRLCAQSWRRGRSAFHDRVRSHDERDLAQKPQASDAARRDPRCQTRSTDCRTAQQKIDALFGADYAREHPEGLVVVVQSAASDWAAARLAAAIEHVAIALAEPEETQHIVQPRELLRPRP